MKFLKISTLFLCCFIVFSACKSSKKTTKSDSMSYMDRMYKSLKSELREANVQKLGDTVKVIYPEIAMFDFGKSAIKTEAKSSFVRFANVIKEYPKVGIVIHGYTDNIGSDDVNMKLSSDRAQSGQEILVQNGVDASTMSTDGMGAAHPIMTNATDQGRAANRRVEFLIYQMMQ